MNWCRPASVVRSCTMDWQVVLTVGGAVFELTGLGLVVFDVRDARRSARAARRRYDSGEAMTFPVSRSWTMRYDIEGEQPAVEERIAALETAVADMRAEYLQRIDETRSAVREEAFDRIRTAM